jgi:dTDP-4-amino-4,6-dideoxygalactose transaminase
MTIQLFVPTFDIDACLAEIRECLERGWTGLGFKTVAFEKAWSDYTGHPHSHFVNSATSGLHLAINVFRDARGWEDGDEIITPSLTFVSTNHAILYERMKPVFADVDQYLCLDPAEIEKRITPRTRAVIFVGTGGNTGQYEAVKKLCRERGLVLILDAAHMAGTKLHGQTPTADVVSYSFQAVKNLPTADSGMICFEDEELDAIARKKTWLGINKDTYARSGDKGSYKWMYDVEYVGFKYHGNSIMASIGLAQLPHLDKDNAYRRQLAEWYDLGVAENNRVERIQVAPGCTSARHLYQIAVDDRDGLLEFMNKNEIFPGVHYRDNTEYRMFADGRDNVPNARHMSDRILSLPMHMRLTQSDVQRVVEIINTYTR